MKPRRPLTFTPRQVRLKSDDPLNSLRLGAPGSGAGSMEAFALTANAAGAGGLGGTGDGDLVAFPWPEFPEELPVIERAEMLLQAAAGIEHALLIQYLYTGYSCTPDSKPERTLLGVAVEEMSHLMTVQNLLYSIGSTPYLNREDIADLFPFPLRFEPFAKSSLAKFVIAESPESPSLTPEEAVLFEEIATHAEVSAGQQINMVGMLYALLGVFFATAEILANGFGDVGADDPWLEAVRRLAELAQDRYGEGKIHLPADFQIIDNDKQARLEIWNRSQVQGAEAIDFRVFRIGDREGALVAIRDIAIQGEGLSGAAAEGATPHYRRFFDLYEEAFGDGADPPRVAPVPIGAEVSVGMTSTGANGISHPTTLPWAYLADIRYWILLSCLEQSLLAPANDRFSLVSWCFSEMFHLKRLAGILTRLPSQPEIEASVRAAAVPFNLPSEFPSDQPPNASSITGDSAPWSPLIARLFQMAIDLEAELLSNVASGTAERRLLSAMLRVDRRKHLEAAARARGESTASSFDRVRESLEWAAGSGAPGHGGEGRFWNLPLDAEAGETSLRNLKLFNVPMITDSSTTAAIYQALFDPGFAFGQMPLMRGKLTETETGQALLEQIRKWIDEEGAPGHDDQD